MSSYRTSESASYPPIDDYALIGDCRSAGLVSRDGSLDWLCLPRFDSPSIFAAVLDTKNGGRFLVRPLGEYRTERRYLANTNLPESEAESASIFPSPTVWKPLLWSPFSGRPREEGSSGRFAGGRSGRTIVHTRDLTATRSCAAPWH